MSNFPPQLPNDWMFFGCDPDMHDCPWAIVRQDLSISRLGIHRSKGSTEQDAVLGMVTALVDTSDFPSAAGTVAAYAVEFQEIYRDGHHRTKNPRNILHLGHISGAMLLWCRIIFRDAKPYMPVPSAWKGQIDKLPHHRRILMKAGIPEANIDYNAKGGYCGIKNHAFSQFNRGDWKHITDAVGLAQYAAEQWKYQTEKSALLANAQAKKAGA